MLDSSKTMKLEDCNFSFVKIQIAVLRFWKEKFSISPYIFLKCPNFTFGHRLEVLKHFSLIIVTSLMITDTLGLRDLLSFVIQPTPLMGLTQCRLIAYEIHSQCLKITKNIAYEFFIFGIFHQFFVISKLTCLVTLFDLKLKIVNVARFARNEAWFELQWLENFL